MPQNANEPLPSLALFVAERAAQIAEDREMVWQAALAERPAAQPASSGTARKCQLHGVRGFAFQTGSQSQLLRGETQQAPFGTAQQSFSGAIDQAQLIVVVEGEDREINLLHYCPQEAIGFQRAQALFPNHSPNPIHFNYHLTHAPA